jgi:Taurine catabolism dioxygenase TauD, TfdA family
MSGSAVRAPLAPTSVATQTPRAIGGAKAWTTADLAADRRWIMRADEELHREVRGLAQWASAQDAPELRYDPGAIELPALRAFAMRVRDGLREGRGVVRVVGFDPALDDSSLRMAYLAIGLEIGEALSNYGRLFDVKDRGEDYRNSAAPVSMTREDTSFHTDSSARDVEPDEVGLLCLHAAAQGGESMVSSAATAHDALLAEAPQALALLYRDYCRDVVTPGTERNLDRIRDNRFPIFRRDGDAPTFRYMRYWIERAHALIDEPLDAARIDAFDRLDAALADSRHMLSFTLQRGEMLWVDNRRMAHNRSAFVDHPTRPRTMVRMWTAARDANRDR